MCGTPYVITASMDGFHKYGSMGEQTVVTLNNGQVSEQRLGMVPIRITIVVSLRELQPLSGPGTMMIQDTFGQVNPLDTVPEMDPLCSVEPQKVGFYSPEGNKMNFLATPLHSSGVLSGGISTTNARLFPTPLTPPDSP